MRAAEASWLASMIRCGVAGLVARGRFRKIDSLPKLAHKFAALLRPRCNQKHPLDVFAAFAGVAALSVAKKN